MSEHPNIERVMARWSLTRADVLRVVIFCYRHDGPSLSHALFDYVRGVGAAAVAAGRTPGSRISASSVK